MEEGASQGRRERASLAAGDARARMRDLPPPAPAPTTLPVAGQSRSWKDPCRHRRGQGRPSLRYRQ